MAINAQNRTLPDWFTRIRTRQTVLPRFQRFEAWGHSNVRQLFNTILQGLPVGALLVLEVGGEEPFLSRPIVGAPAEGERVTEHVLDGQQRLTALWRGLHNNYEDRTYFLCLKPDQETGAPYFVDSVSRWRREDEKTRRPFWVDNPREQWQRQMVPLDLCGPGDPEQQRFRTWRQEAIEDSTERERISDIVASIRLKFATFNVPYLSLPVTTSKETALNVFVQMNTSAAPLTTYDIVVAQVEASLGQSLHDLVAQIKEASPEISEYYPPENLALYASALLQGRAPGHTTYMAKDFGGQLLQNWNRLLNGVKRAVAFLEEERIFDATRLPTDVVVPVLVALWAIAPAGLDAEGRARTILRRYLWRAFFSARYERSTGTRSFADFQEIAALIKSASAPTPAIFDDTQFPLPTAQELSLAAWPRKSDRLAKSILAVALRRGGLDLADGSSVTRANLLRREYHHLFPDAHLRNRGVPDDQIYRSLNCAVVTWSTNRSIGARDPERYITERSDRSDLGVDEIKTRLASHLVPYDELVAGDYGKFIERRAAMVADAMTKLCGGSSRLD